MGKEYNQVLLIVNIASQSNDLFINNGANYLLHMTIESLLWIC